MLNKTYRRLAAFMMSLFVLLGGMQVEVLAANVNVNVYDYKTIQGYSLGDAGAFGIFANTYEIAGSIESNFAAETFIRKGSHTVGTKINNGVPGNTETYLYVGEFDELTNAGNNNNWVGALNLNSPVSLFSIGEKYSIEKKSDGKYYIEVPNNDIQNKMSDHEITLLDNSNKTFDVKMNQSLRRLESVADNYMKLEATDTTLFDQSNWDQNNEGLDLHEGANVFHIDVEDLTKNQNREFKFNNISEATQVVINVNIPRNYNDTIDFKKNMNNPSVYSVDVGKILWNFGDYDGTINIGSMRGTLLAPRASIVGTSSATAGTLIGEYVYTEGTHYKNDFVEDDFEFEIPVFDYKAIFSMNKWVEPSPLEMDLDDPELNTIDLFYEIGFEDVPAEAVQVAKQKEIVLVIDTSGSMKWSVSGNKSVSSPEQRMTIAKNAANLFLDSMVEDENANVGIVSFSSNGVIKSDIINVSNNLNQLKSNVNGLSAVGGTNVGDGIRLAKHMLNNGNDVEKYVVFLGDGKPTGYSYSGNKNRNNYYYGTGSAPKTFINSGSNDIGGDSSQYAKNMTTLLDQRGVRSYYIGFTKDADAKGLILNGDVENSTFHYAETAQDLEALYQEIADEIKSSVYLQTVSFEETLPDGMKIKSVDFTSVEPEVSEISSNEQSIKVEFGNIIYKLNAEETAYVAEPIRFTITAYVEEAGEYIIGKNNSSAVHYIDFDTAKGHQYFDEIEFNAFLMNTDNVLIIDTNLTEVTNIVAEANDGLHIRVTSEKFDIVGVYVLYSILDDVQPADFARDQSNGNPWPEIGSPGANNIFIGTEADPDGDPNTPAPADVVIGEIQVDKTGFYNIYAIDEYDNYTFETVHIIVNKDMPGVI
jgi:hypothetical protein